MMTPTTNEQLKFALRESQTVINLLTKKVEILEQKNKELKDGILRDPRRQNRAVNKPLASASRMSFV
jgi:hypothetical protein